MTASTQSAVAAAVACAHRLGVTCAEPVVLGDAWHVLVHLKPHPLVARVSSALPFPEGPNPDDVPLELEVAGHAARAGAPVVPPSADVDPGPHRHDGHVVTFWRYVERRGDLDSRAAGRGLRLIHDALEDCAVGLPPRGHGDDVRAMLGTLEPSADVELLLVLSAGSPEPDGQALHGDAHLDNCLQSADGPLWHDLESTCRGPREYDLAALVLGDRRTGVTRARETLCAYGSHDAALLDALVPVYAAWVYASMLLALPRRPDLRPLLDDRIRWLRGHARTLGLA
ncbi:MAG TPA: phosphotransferase [Gaiellaceae bacterium]|nr:phosphotransferase [Gaiellaceae bacterium]